MKKNQQQCIWSEVRQPRSPQHHNSSTQTQKNEYETRSIFQQDYDRLLFSTPVRRLADKTQVWPMDENDGVRTRLTHSHEVANLARSIGTKVFAQANEFFVDSQGKQLSLTNVIQPLLLAIGLGHDLGNPPFGHQGEAAIGNWFKAREDSIFSYTQESGLVDAIPPDYHSEFTEFDGNPQSLRLLTKLQTHIDGVGLDLSAATLAASLKYPVSFPRRDDTKPACKKGGYFESERAVVEWIHEQTGLKEGLRHPLTWIMEACDDIAYSILDIDDVLKKGIMSPDDVLILLKHSAGTEDNDIVKKIQEKFLTVESKNLVTSIQKDIKIQYLRAFLIEALISHASTAFVTEASAIFTYTHKVGLMDQSNLCNNLKTIARENAFNHPTVLRAEARGAAAIDGLMTELWNAISDRKTYSDLRSKRNTPRAKYIFSLISPNYIEQAVQQENSTSQTAKSVRYRELRLLTDMVSGMTDSFALRLWEDLRAFK